MISNSPDLRESFSVLEIPQTASLADAKVSYRDLVRIWHPDRFQADERLRRRCEEKVKKLNLAFQMVESALSRASGWQMPAAPTPAWDASGGANLDPMLYRGKWGYVDRTGAIRIAPAYDSAAEFSEGLAAVSRGGAFGYVSPDGSLAIDLRFTGAGPFSQGMARVRFGRWGYLRANGEWAIRPRFDAGHDFHQGVAPVKVDGKWGLIDSNGLWVLLPRFDDMQPFDSGRSLAREGNRSFTVLKTGEVRSL